MLRGVSLLVHGMVLQSEIGIEVDHASTGLPCLHGGRGGGAVWRAQEDGADACNLRLLGTGERDFRRFADSGIRVFVVVKDGPSAGQLRLRMPSTDSFK
jgi:hypothetical protein